MDEKLHGIIESVLFAAGEAVKVQKLAEIAAVDGQMIRQTVEEMNRFYETHQSGFQIIEIDEGFQICTRPEYYTCVQAIAGIRRQQGLSNAALEALSIIAYNQPVTRATVDYVRGVNSDGALHRLAERGLIEEKGRLDTPGKPILYVTTDEFLRVFGLKSLQDLPEINETLGDEEEPPEQMRIEI